MCLKTLSLLFETRTQLFADVEHSSQTTATVNGNAKSAAAPTRKPKHGQYFGLNVKQMKALLLLLRAR